MANVLLTYDIKTDVQPRSINESKNYQVKEGLRALGYHNSWVVKDGPTYWLPNTTVWKTGISAADAKQDLINVARKCGATIERQMAVEFTTWAGKEDGVPYSEQW